MKTFDEKDLITWSNRHTVKVGDKGYFASSITDLHNNIKSGYVYELTNIDGDDNWCFKAGTFSYGFFLPVDAVKENKIYRACKTVQELYELIFNTKSKADDRFYIDELVGTVIHFKHKEFKTQYYECITGIVVYNDGDIAIKIGCCKYDLSELFEDYEIEINDKWLPFGVLKE